MTARQRAGLRRETFDALEAELRSYEATKSKVREISEDIATRGMGVNLEAPAAPTGGVSDPTLERATALAQSELLREMERTVKAIDSICERLNTGLLKLTKMHYFQHMPAAEVRQALGIHANTFTRWRDDVIEELATELGRW